MIPNLFTIRRRQDVLVPIVSLATLSAPIAIFLLHAHWLEGLVLAVLLTVLPLGILFSPQQAFEGESLWQRLDTYDDTTVPSQKLLDAIDELEYTTTFARKNGVVALEKHLPMLNYSHPYLSVCIPYLLDAKTENDLEQWCQLQERNFKSENTALINTFFHASQTLLPIASLLNAFLILIALKGGLSPELASTSFLMSLGTWAMYSLIFQPFLSHIYEAEIQEIQIRKMILHGIKGVWKQTHPHALRRDLEAYLPPRELHLPIEDAHHPLHH
jgi:flagellar motor component MotA